MSEELLNLKASPGNIWGTHDPAPWNATIKYRTSHPIEALDQDNYFLPIRSAFLRHRARPGENAYQAGDKIEATCIQDDGTWKEATYEVSFVDEYCVKVERLTEWRHGGHRPKLDLVAEHSGFGKWLVSYTNGKPFRRNVTKEEAQQLVGHPLGKQDEPEKVAS